MHDLTGPMPNTYSDAAKRCADTITMHAIVMRDQKYFTQRWVAIRLSDGGSDGALYDTRVDAVRHQLHENLCCYVMVPPDGMTAQEAEVFMIYNRALYDNGARMPDPQQHISPLRQEQLNSQLALLNTKTPRI